MTEHARRLTGIEKAAVVLLSMEEASASKLFEMMTEEEIKEISHAMSNLGALDNSTIDNLVNDFTVQVSTSAGLIGNPENTEKLLTKYLSADKVSAIMEEIRGPAGKNTWDKLSNVNEDTLASYLKNEYPQTIALIMSKIDAKHAAKVMAILPEDLTYEVMLRMLTMEPVKKEVLDRVEKTLKSEFISTLTKTQAANSYELLAEIFNNFDRSNEQKFMAMLEKNSPESAQSVRDLMLTFEDLSSIGASGVQVLLQNVDKNKLPIALKGASEAMRKLFLDNMSKRAAKILQEDIEGLGPVRLKDVDEAQVNIVNIAKTLADNGQIVLSSDSGEDEYVY
jgi:flagellar motor switch protein FliG